jgi:hypothetical protein
MPGRSPAHYEARGPDRFRGLNCETRPLRSYAEVVIVSSTAWKAVTEVLISLQSRLGPPRAARVDLKRLVAGGVSLARVVVGQLGHDTDHDHATETRDFSYRGVDYQVSLSASEAKTMDQALAPYVEVARRVAAERPPSRRPVAEAAKSAPVAKDVRAWAVAEGIGVSERGRLSAEVVRHYQDAHRG